MFYDNAEILESHDLDIALLVDIGSLRLGFVGAASDLDLAHRGEAREGHAPVADLQLLGRNDGHRRRPDLLLERKTLPGLGPQRDDGGDDRQYENDEDDDSPRHGTEITEGEVHRTAVADQRQHGPDRHPGQQDQFGHQKQQAEKNEQYNIEHLHKACGILQ